MPALSWRVSRDSLLFFGGVAGIAYETVVGGAERPVLLVVLAGACGLPVFLRGDEAQTKAVQTAVTVKAEAKNADAELLLANLPPADLIEVVRTLLEEREKPPVPGHQRRRTDPGYEPPTDGDPT